ncbi:hypothetical protein ACOIC7_28970, partial [Klebsiella pneumoniae]|uniref:hypothetical protein n=1 Tax=Klebsiella pneumoniae TaxID=573 RepID=UPI003B5A014B
NSAATQVAGGAEALQLLFELFHSGQQHRTHVDQYVPILALLTKVRRANHEVSFCHERTQYTPICPKIMFCCKKDPTVVDLLPGTPYNMQIANC